MERLARWLMVCAVLVGCGEDAAILRVDLRTDWVPMLEFTDVELSFDGGEGPTVRVPVDARANYVEGVRVATIDDLPPGRAILRTRLLDGRGLGVAQRRLVVDVTGPTNVVTVLLTRDCSAIECPGVGDPPGATECVGQRCVPPECSPENPAACGEDTCGSDADCPPARVSCARALCADGVCFEGSDFSSCGAGEICHPERGCVSLGDRDAGGDLDAGPGGCGDPCDTGNACEEGVLDCSGGAPVCASVSLTPSGVRCREAADVCDAAEECTGTGPGCPDDVFADAGTTCADGFCDGGGACTDSCTPGAPCSTGNTCELGAIVCTGGVPSCARSGDVANGASCGSDETGSWGACAYSGTCDESGTQDRSVTMHRCMGGACRASTTMETRACTRDTDDITCGTSTDGPWGSCGGFMGTCGESGTQSRDVTALVCQAGTCQPTVTMGTRACNRSTGGTTCGSTTYGSWGSCGGFTSTCDETGTRSRSETRRECSGGSCTDVAGTDVGTCTRSTGGTSCMGPAGRPACATSECVGGVCEWTGDTCSSGDLCCPGADECLPEVIGSC